MAPILPADVNTLAKVVQSNALLVRQLQALCQTYKLNKSGVKAGLQSRLVNCETPPPSYSPCFLDRWDNYGDAWKIVRKGREEPRKDDNISKFFHSLPLHLPLPLVSFWGVFKEKLNESTLATL
jgi:hypothetical protein